MRRFALSCLAVAVSAVTAMADAPPKIAAGHIAWFDIATTDFVKAKAFYGPLFGWTFAPVSYSDQAATIVVDGAQVGTLRPADGALSGFNGVVYVQVDDIVATCAKAKELGGTVPPVFPFNLPDSTGAIAIALDPSGHPIGMLQRSLLPPRAPKKPAAK